jgi:methyl-accepting chemotaxis protein
MTKAMHAFRDSARTQIRLNGEAEKNAELVRGMTGNLKRLADGDLTADIAEDYPASYLELKTNFNEALGSLRTLIGSVTESTVAIRTGSSEIATASEDLARRTEANAASLEETSAAVTQMDSQLKATAESANRTVRRADDAITTIKSGRAIADEAMQAMTRVNESAKGIDSVIEGLDKIAFQTRVLAMNAAVEAGRAGEAGRGFAVVADLVSALAMRAEEEAGRARDQLTATQTDVVAAAEMVQRVDGALANITGDVGEVHTLLGQIATDNKAQSATISEISVAIQTMDRSTQQNAAMVEETSAAARNLSGEVSALAEQAARFKVEQGRRSRTSDQHIEAMKPWHAAYA